jgi:purine-binding chemotaxis protein CheW
MAMTPLDELGSKLDVATDGRQFLTFALGAEDYGVEILKVQEIKGYAPVTPVPNTPAHVRGIMNLRGAVIPILDLRAVLGMTEAASSQFSVIIIVQVAAKAVGLVVDTVSDVVSIASDHIQQTPDFGTQFDAGLISGIARIGERLVVLLDLERVLGTASDRCTGLLAGHER